jgi:hypothetical protein
LPPISHRRQASTRRTPPRDAGYLNEQSIWRPNGDATLTTSRALRPTLTPPRIHTLVTGEVAQRFVARERTLTEDRALIDAMVRLLSAS